MGSSDHDSQKIPAMMMYEIKMTIFGRVELSSAIYRGPSEGLKIKGGEGGWQVIQGFLKGEGFTKDS